MFIFGAAFYSISFHSNLIHSTPLHSIANSILLFQEPEAYKAWFSEFGLFLKEGVCRDFENQADLAKLLYFESSSLPAGELSSLDE